MGFHTMMAMAPAYHMAAELPEGQKPLPILKVLYVNGDDYVPGLTTIRIPD